MLVVATADFELYHDVVATLRDRGVTFTTAELAIDGETFGIDVKVASDDAGTVMDVSAEFDDAADIAEAVDRPVREVMRRAEEAVRDAE